MVNEPAFVANWLKPCECAFHYQSVFRNDGRRYTRPPGEMLTVFTVAVEDQSWLSVALVTYRAALSTSLHDAWCFTHKISQHAGPHFRLAFTI